MIASEESVRSCSSSAFVESLRGVSPHWAGAVPIPLSFVHSCDATSGLPRDTWGTLEKGFPDTVPMGK